MTLCVHVHARVYQVSLLLGAVTYSISMETQLVTMYMHFIPKELSMPPDKLQMTLVICKWKTPAVYWSGYVRLYYCLHSATNKFLAGLYTYICLKPNKPVMLSAVAALF